MTLLRSTARTFKRFVENAERTRARRELLERSDRTLADAGLSRALLESGNDAWPWRTESDESMIPRANPRPLPLSRIVTGTPVPAPSPALSPAATASDRDAWSETMREVA